MTDVVSKAKRSKMMSGIQGKDTKPEMQIRTALHGLGYRYKLHNKNLPGKPDLVFPKYHAVLFVHGCFWHLHNCHLFKWPSTRKEFWMKKITGNKERDIQNIQKLKKRDWRILIVWECSLKGKNRQDFNSIIEKITNWLESGSNKIEITGDMH